jgi:hypothetical protein
VGAPDAPTAVMATVNADGSMTTSWTAPTAVGAGIDHFTATADDSNGHTASCDSDDDADTNCDIAETDLLAGTEYTVTVVAVGVSNTTDNSNDSVASDASDPATTPMGAPTIQAPTFPDADTVSANWTLPTSTGDVDHYTATTSPAGGTCSTDAGDNTTTTCDIDAADLTPGVVYTISVVSVGTTASDTSAPSDPTAPFVLGKLNAPTGVTATAGSGEATVSWTAPLGAPTGIIAYYTVTSSGGQVCNTIDPATTSCTVTGLDNLTSYTFTVVAHSSNTTAHPDSDASAASAAVIPLPTTVTIKAGINSKYVTAENAGAWWLIANRASAGAWEQFSLVDNGDGTISLKAGVNGKYVTAEWGGAGPLIANRSSIGGWEKFTLVDNGDGTFSLKAAANGKYVTAEAAGGRALVANRSSVGSWEKFTITGS